MVFLFNFHEFKNKTKKFFQSEQYLDAHMSRRHANILPMNIFNPNFPIVKNVVFAE